MNIRNEGGVLPSVNVNAMTSQFRMLATISCGNGLDWRRFQYPTMATEAQIVHIHFGSDISQVESAIF
jgi:hypothetical protein